MELKVPTLNHLVFLGDGPILSLSRDLTLSHLININSGVLKRVSMNNKDISITQEIPRALGDFFRNQRQRPNIFLVIP